MSDGAAIITVFALASVCYLAGWIDFSFLWAPLP